MLPNTTELIARFLRTNGYTETLKSFISEASLPPDIGTNGNDTVTIESILEEKKNFDVSLGFEKLGLQDEDRGWTTGAPSVPLIYGQLPTRSNILNISVVPLSLSPTAELKQYISVTTADRKLHLIDPSSPTLNLVRSYTSFQDSPILDIATMDSRFLLVATMSGKLILYDTVTDQVIDERKDHAKYVVKLAIWSSNRKFTVVSAGWDAKLCVYQIDCTHDSLTIGEPLAALNLTSIPETICFVQWHDSTTPILVVARRDSAFLHFYAVPSSVSSAMTFIGKQNLAPHSNAWVAFTPSDVQVCPTDPSIVAVATSSTPHMKLLVLKLLLPHGPLETSDATAAVESPQPTSQAAQARNELLIQNKEEAAILINVSTLSPQTAYSTPRLVWRPDGSGIYVSSDDGIIRGIESSTGKIIHSLNGHDNGSKLRCLWAGYIRARPDVSSPSSSSTDKEYLMSGGFDQKLILWH